MKLYNFIEENLKIDDNEQKAALWSALKGAIKDCKTHLSQITAQLNDFDIHDTNHSEKVLENIENLLGVKMVDLSFLEATLIYSSCFFHDAAMALPKWEYDLLKAFEGCEEHYNRDVKPCIKNDFKPVQSIIEIKKIIDENKSYIHMKYSNVESFIFAPENEAELQLDLAKRVQSYEEFRNGFSDQLRNKKSDCYDYLNNSNLIRCDFIRETHSKRIIELIGYMRKKFRAVLKKSVADKYLNVLAEVCKAHGDKAVDVKKLAFEYEIDTLGKVNVQFVAIMLRLGDIIHFSSDRAPMSLFAEKKITDPLSYKHWKSKFEETRYEFSNTDSKTTVKFKAYCSSPDTYYFLQDYLNCIDDEIALYFTFLQQLEYDDIPNRGNYDIKIAITTDRTGIEADTSIFIPENDAKFTLEQSKILGLLTGAQLYKDEYLCLRELYQNSLDACKCMKEIDKTRSVSGNYKISFGLSTDSKCRTYIYCLDNGTGMTMDIIKNHLLRIGNSYYKSRDFIRKNADWSNAVNPTSQFGIGILSCFMLGDALEITTKHYENANITLSFVIEGANERFYHIPTNELDNERIGEHGTLVKIILNEKTSKTINSNIPMDLQYFIFAGNNSIYDETFDKASYKEFENSLFWKVNKQIGIPAPNIEVCVYDKNDKSHLIIPFNEIFDFRKYPNTNVAAFATVWEKYHFRNGIENPYKDVIPCRDFIKDIPICVESDGVQLNTFICLPQKGIPLLNRYIFSFSRYLWNTSQLTILVDGVVVNENSAHLTKYALLGYGLSQNSSVILNFTGEKRPVLSVDRNNIINFSEDLTEVLKKLVDKLITKVVEAVVAHLREEKLGADSAEAQLAINTILYIFDEFSGDILMQLSATEYDLLKLDKVNLANQKNNSLSELFRLPDATFKNIDIRQLDEVSRQIVFGKAFAAEAIEVLDENINIKSNQFFPPSYALKEDRTLLPHVQYVLKADKWEGCFEQYDLVTSLWPVVPEKLFDKITEREREDNYSLDDRRIKIISQIGNGLYGMGIIEPALVNPKMGISSHNKELFGKPPCLIGRVENIQNYFSLFELNSHRRLAREEHKDYVLFEYVAPREITEEDELKLKDYNGQDDTYVQGVREGWSILFLGYDSTYYVLPGVHKRKELIELIPPSIRARKGGIEYYNLDGIKLDFE